MKCAYLLTVVKNIHAMASTHRIKKNVCSLKKDKQETIRINEALLNHGIKINYIGTRSCNFIRGRNYEDCPFFKEL